MGNQLRFFKATHIECQASLRHGYKCRIQKRIFTIHRLFFFFASLFCYFAWQCLLSSKRFAPSKILFLHFNQPVAAYLQLSWMILKAVSGLPIEYLKRSFGLYCSLLVPFSSLSIYLSLSLSIRWFGQCLLSALWSDEPSNIAYDMGLLLHTTCKTSVFDGFDIQWISRMARKQLCWKLPRTPNVFFFFLHVIQLSKEWTKCHRRDTNSNQAKILVHFFSITFWTNMSFMILKSSRRFFDADKKSGTYKISKNIYIYI